MDSLHGINFLLWYQHLRVPLWYPIDFRVFRGIEENAFVRRTLFAAELKASGHEKIMKILSADIRH
jgi:hypothetical protein